MRKLWKRLKHGIWGCPGPFDLLRQEQVLNKAAFISAEFWIELSVVDRRVRCPECGRVHMVIAGQEIRHEGNFFAE